MKRIIWSKRKRKNKICKREEKEKIKKENYRKNKKTKVWLYSFKCLCSKIRATVPLSASIIIISMRRVHAKQLGGGMSNLELVIRRTFS